MMKALLVFGIVMSMFFALSANFIGGALSLYNVSAENLSSLDIMKNISDVTTDVRDSINQTQTSPNTIQGFDLGGIWASIQLLFGLPEMLGNMISGLGSIFNFDTSVVIGGIMLLITTILALNSIYFGRSGKEL